MEKTFWQKCRRIFTDYIGLNLLDGVIVGAVTGAFLWATDMPHILPVAVLAGVANMIPTFGPAAGAVIGAVLVALGKPINALWFLLFTVLLQLVDGYLLKPKLFGSSLGVPSLAVLAATLLGGYFFGFFGILLAVPVAAVIFLLWREKLRPKKKEESIPEESPQEQEKE